ncbi:DUF3782 domain-containing protein [Candidatus Poribacteria bacterium]|nr:DUF3782 domain-containing protein [Candidatus Poribacteria bacterium]
MLLKEDIAFREEVMNQLTGVLATKDDIARILSKLEENSQILEEHSQILQEHSRILQEHSETLKRFGQILDKHTKTLDEHTKSINKFDRTLSAVGARWGISSEESFRGAMRGVLEDLGYQVRKWRIRDEDGRVYGHPTMVEADILIVNGQCILMEIKSSVSTGDVGAFARISQLYEAKEGTKPRLVMVSLFINARAQVLGEQMGMELYTSPEEVVE